MDKRFVRLIAVVTVTAGLGIGGIAAAKPVTSVSGDIHTEFNGDFSPKVLSKAKLTPVTSSISASLKTLSGVHIPPLKELVLEGDGNTSISVKGFPVCESSGIRSQRLITPAEMRKICGKALVGGGTMKAEILFPEMLIPVSSKLLVFNGGIKDRVSTLYIHAYITVPVPAAIITTVKVKRVNKGRFGWQAVATIPKITGGSGSVSFFKLKLKKGILAAKCPDGHLNARITAGFGSTPPTRLTSTLVRPCTQL